MEILILIIMIVWVFGWIKELAYFYYRKEKHGLHYSSESEKYAVPIVLFFVWPYIYFYYKAHF